MSFQPTGFSQTIFRDRYAFTESETWEQACARVASQMALAESPEKQEKYKIAYYDALVNNLFVPGGRIWYNSGRNNPQLLNCFVLDPDKDSKEGWANSAYNMIVTSMTGGGCGDDFSSIRPRGATIKGQKGTAPGAIELMKLINSCAAPIRAGGQRRVALMFSLGLDHPDIEEFIDSKLKNGELTHANISVLSERTKEFIKAIKSDGDWELRWNAKWGPKPEAFPRNKVKARDLWDIIAKNAYDSAEPGFLNWELVESESPISYIEKCVTTNPCLPAYAKVLTPNGIKNLSEIEIGATIWSGTRWTTVVNKWSTGVKPVYKYSTTAGYFVGTTNHRIVENGNKVEVREAKSIDWSLGPKMLNTKLDPQDIMDGLVLGDGGVHKASNNLVGLYIGKKDVDYFTSEIAELIVKHRPGITEEFYTVQTTITASELPKTYERVVPDRFYYGDPNKKAGFLRGLFTANGSLAGNRISLKQTSLKLIEQVREMLSSLGIYSYVTTNKAKSNVFSNGVYQMRESYDLNIASGRSDFRDYIGFIQKYKQDRILPGGREKYSTSTIKKVEYIEDTEVFDITVDDENHVFWSSGCLVSNCGEIALSAMDCCCLGHLVLPRFVSQNGEVDYALLGNTIRTGVRFLDNVLSVNTFPLPEMREKSQKLRRIGLGTTGLADMLALLNLRYGSPEAITFIDKLYRFISKVAYEASIMLAIEKGPFPACDPKKHIETGFVKRMPQKIKSLILEHGIRNCAVLTQAPTGTVSLLSGNCSSGIEPIFSAAYERRYWDGAERKVELIFHPLFEKFMSEGRDVSHLVGAAELSVRDHLEVQKTIQRHVDNAVSKTINLPQDYPLEDMKEMWLEYLPHLKGTTFYRENTRGFYNEKTGQTEEPPLKAIPIDEAKKRFEESHKIGIGDVVDCPTGVCGL